MIDSHKVTQFTNHTAMKLTTGMQQYRPCTYTYPDDGLSRSRFESEGEEEDMQMLLLLIT